MLHFNLLSASFLTFLFALPAVGCASPVGQADREQPEDVTAYSDETEEREFAGAGGTTADMVPVAGSGGGIVDPTVQPGGQAPGTGGETSGSGGSDGSGGTTSGIAPELCEWIFAESSGLFFDGVCHPQCTPSVGTDGMGWGWENNGSCIHPGSQIASESTSCEFDVTREGECPPNGSFRCPGEANCGCELVSGLGNNKSQLWAAGASEEPYMIAAAMMETPSMSAQDPTYPYGDGKWDDAFNAGVAKQNWGMIRTCHAPWNGLEPWDYDTAAGMNTDLSLDVQVFRECRDYYGDEWWTYHRQGLGYTPGSDFWREQDIEKFKAAMDWTSCLLEGHYSDDVRFWVDVNAI